GMVIAFGVPTPATDPRQLIGDVMMVAAAVFWAATTLTIKASPLTRASAEKVMLYQLVVSAPLMAIAAILLGERVAHVPSMVAIGSMAYQTVWVVSVTFVIWFALIARYSASRLSAFTFLAPLFGVAAGHLVLGDPLTPAFAAAVTLVAAGLVLVNRAQECIQKGGLSPAIILLYLSRRRLVLKADEYERATSQHCRGQCGRRPRRRCRPVCRAVDDQSRHRRRRGNGAAGCGIGGRGLRARAYHR